MSGHKGHAKHAHVHTGVGTAEGWVDGLSNLREGDRAVELLEDGAELRLGAKRDGGAAPAAARKTTAAVTLLDDDFDAALARGLEYLAKEIEEVGEVVLEVGTPTGWGPVGMSAELLAKCMEALGRVAAEGGAHVTTLHAARVVEQQTAAGPVPCHAVDILVRRDTPLTKDLPPIEVRVAIIGNVDSGKSTMVGVLTRSMLDNGRGLARAKVFKHHHEEMTGRTSSIGQHTLCLDADGKIINDASFRAQTCGSYISRAAKVITLVDLAGHEKYFRTTAYGLTAHMPDYACLIVGANMGVVGMCKEHLGVALALKVPVFFVITKVDIAPDHILKETVSSLIAILKKPGVRKRPFLVKSAEDVLLCARNINADALAPIFLTSSVTGRGLELVRMFYNLMPQRHRWFERRNEPAEFVVDETFMVPCVGTVVAGTVTRGRIVPNSTLLMGPDATSGGAFAPVAIKSIHYKRVPVAGVVAGQTAAMLLKKVKHNAVRKGMVLVDERVRPKASWEFNADIAILTHTTTIQPRYQAVIHCEIIRQAARVVAMDCERLRSGDRACVRFRFIQRPEYITARSRFMFREGTTKGIGIVLETEHDFLKVPGADLTKAKEKDPALAAAAAPEPKPEPEPAAT